MDATTLPPGNDDGASYPQVEGSQPLYLFEAKPRHLDSRTSTHGPEYQRVKVTPAQVSLFRPDPETGWGTVLVICGDAKFTDGFQAAWTQCLNRRWGFHAARIGQQIHA